MRGRRPVYPKFGVDFYGLGTPWFPADSSGDTPDPSTGLLDFLQQIVDSFVMHV